GTRWGRTRYPAGFRSGPLPALDECRWGWPESAAPGRVENCAVDLRGAASGLTTVGEHAAGNIGVGIAFLHGPRAERGVDRVHRVVGVFEIRVRGGWAGVSESAADNQQRVVLDVSAKVGQVAAAPRHRVRLVTVHLLFEVGQ